MNKDVDLPKRETRFVWISGLPEDIHEGTLKQSLENFGKIQTSKIHKKNNEVGAIVVFLSVNAASETVKKLTHIDYHPVEVNFCESNGSPYLDHLGSQQSVQLISKLAEKNRSLNHLKPISKNDYDEISSEDESSNQSSDSFSSSTSRSNSLSKSRSRSLSHSDHSSPSPLSIKKFSSDSRQTAIKIWNLSVRASNVSLREALFHEFKRFGKISYVSLNGDAHCRYAVITYRRPEDARKAGKAYDGKVFLGGTLRVDLHDGYKVEDLDISTSDQVKDEYHSKATRTLFVGNLIVDLIKKQDIYRHFGRYGTILDVDIKQNISSGNAYAFVQFSDITSVVNALNDKRTISIHGRDVKLGFGKSQATRCIWLDALAPSVDNKFLYGQMKRFGKIRSVEINPKLKRGLVEFENTESAQAAVAEMKLSALAGKRVQIDFASSECKEDFFRQLRKAVSISQGALVDDVKTQERCHRNNNVPEDDHNKATTNLLCSKGLENGRHSRPEDIKTSLHAHRSNKRSPSPNLANTINYKNTSRTLQQSRLSRDRTSSHTPPTSRNRTTLRNSHLDTNTPLSSVMLKSSENNSSRHSSAWKTSHSSPYSMSPNRRSREQRRPLPPLLTAPSNWKISSKSSIYPPPSTPTPSKLSSQPIATFSLDELESFDKESLSRLVKERKQLLEELSILESSTINAATSNENISPRQNREILRRASRSNSRTNKPDSPHSAPPLHNHPSVLCDSSGSSSTATTDNPSSISKKVAISPTSITTPTVNTNSSYGNLSSPSVQQQPTSTHDDEEWIVSNSMASPSSSLVSLRRISADPRLEHSTISIYNVFSPETLPISSSSSSTTVTTLTTSVLDKISCKEDLTTHDVDERIKQLDAKMILTEKPRQVDYSKYRIRKRDPCVSSSSAPNTVLTSPPSLPPLPPPISSPSLSHNPSNYHPILLNNHHHHSPSDLPSHFHSMPSFMESTTSYLSSPPNTVEFMKNMLSKTSASSSLFNNNCNPAFSFFTSTSSNMPILSEHNNSNNRPMTVSTLSLYHDSPSEHYSPTKSILKNPLSVELGEVDIPTVNASLPPHPHSNTAVTLLLSSSSTCSLHPIIKVSPSLSSVNEDIKPTTSASFTSKNLKTRSQLATNTPPPLKVKPAVTRKKLASSTSCLQEEKSTKAGNFLFMPDELSQLIKIKKPPTTSSLSSPSSLVNNKRDNSNSLQSSAEVPPNKKWKFAEDDKTAKKKNAKNQMSDEEGSSSAFGLFESMYDTVKRRKQSVALQFEEEKVNKNPLKIPKSSMLSKLTVSSASCGEGKRSKKISEMPTTKKTKYQTDDDETDIEDDMKDQQEEDLPCLEKEMDENDHVCHVQSPHSIDENPPENLESVFDSPPSEIENTVVMAEEEEVKEELAVIEEKIIFDFEVLEEQQPFVVIHEATAFHDEEDHRHPHPHHPPRSSTSLCTEPTPPSTSSPSTIHLQSVVDEKESSSSSSSSSSVDHHDDAGELTNTALVEEVSINKEDQLTMLSSPSVPPNEEIIPSEMIIEQDNHEEEQVFEQKQMGQEQEQEQNLSSVERTINEVLSSSASEDCQKSFNESSSVDHQIIDASIVHTAATTVVLPPTTTTTTCHSRNISGNSNRTPTPTIILQQSTIASSTSTLFDNLDRIIDDVVHNSSVEDTPVTTVISTSTVVIQPRTCSSTVFFTSPTLSSSAVGATCATSNNNLNNYPKLQPKPTTISSTSTVPTTMSTTHPHASHLVPIAPSSNAAPLFNTLIAAGQYPKVFTGLDMLAQAATVQQQHLSHTGHFGVKDSTPSACVPPTVPPTSTAVFNVVANMGTPTAPQVLYYIPASATFAPSNAGGVAAHGAAGFVSNPSQASSVVSSAPHSRDYFPLLSVPVSVPAPHQQHQQPICSPNSSNGTRPLSVAAAPTASFLSTIQQQLSPSSSTSTSSILNNNSYCAQIPPLSSTLSTPSSSLPPSILSVNVDTNNKHINTKNNTKTQRSIVENDINTKVLAESYHCLWRGKLSLKNELLPVEMHFVSGTADMMTWSTGLAARRKDIVANITSNTNLGATQTQQHQHSLRICQRMRLEPSHLEGLYSKLNKETNYCMCLCLAANGNTNCSPDDSVAGAELAAAQTTMEDHFIKYLQEKQAAGIINIHDPDTHLSVYVMHIFPPGEFCRSQLDKYMPMVLHRIQDEHTPYLLVLVSTV